MKIRCIGPRGAVVLSALLRIAAGSAPAAAEVDPDPLSRCLALAESAPDDYRSYACFWSEARKNNLLDPAALALRTLLADDPENPHISAYLAAIEMDRGEPQAAAVLYRRAAEGHANLGNATAEAHVRLTFSYLLAVHMGRLDEAEAEIARVRSLMDSVTDPSLPGWLAMRVASLANKRLEFGRALRILQSVESDFFPDGPWTLRQLWLNYMAFTMRALGQLDAAFFAYQAEADLLLAHGDPFGEAIPRRNLTLLAMLSGKSEATCRELAAEALRTAVRGGNRRLESHSHRDLSFLTVGLERLEHAEAAVAISRETAFPVGILNGLRALSFAQAETDPESALVTAKESIRMAEELGDLSQIATSHLAYADVARRVSSREAAEAAGLRALDITEITRRLQPDPEIRARHFGIWTGPYYDLARYLLDDPDASSTGKAFHIMERMRARTLLDELDAARASGANPETDPILEERQETLRQISAVQRRLYDRNVTESERLEARADLVQLEGEDSRLREQLRRADPSFSAVAGTSLASLEQVQEALARDQALLLFQVAGRGLLSSNRSWLLAITRSDTAVFDLPESHWMDGAVALFDGLLESDPDTAVDGAIYLYDRLLGAAMEEMLPDIRRLVIVPDRSLHLLPFGALRASPGDEPLGVRYAISIAPSATVWMHLRSRPREEPKTETLVFADPEIRQSGGSTSRSAAPALPPELQDLGSLPFARKEAASVGQRLGRDPDLLVGHEASEVAFKGALLRDYAVIHLAAHAIVDTLEPLRSGILLAPGAETEDGLLQIRELTELDLSGQLVVLSACRTAGGLVLVGEGPMSLARPFFLAGATTVVGSLWPLPDRAASQLFDRFYSHLASGSSVTVAMREARSDLESSGAPTSAWAGVVVLGDGDRVPFPGGRPGFPRRLSLAAFLIVILLAGLLLRRRSTRRDPPGSGRE